MLNENIKYWLARTVIRDGNQVAAGQVADAYRQCLDTRTYTLFSNRSSATQWTGEHQHRVVALEQPHDTIHVAVGGFKIPEDPNSPVGSANGDMGEPDTAGFDPIFFFHHCFIDRVFWLWQRRHGFTNHLDIVAGYPGTNSSGDPERGGQPHTRDRAQHPAGPEYSAVPVLQTGRKTVHLGGLHQHRKNGLPLRPGVTAGSPGADG